jgi:hypothetical protein
MAYNQDDVSSGNDTMEDDQALSDMASQDVTNQTNIFSLQRLHSLQHDLDNARWTIQFEPLIRCVQDAIQVYRNKAQAGSGYVPRCASELHEQASCFTAGCKRAVTCQVLRGILQVTMSYVTMLLDHVQEHP